jgi:ArsR family metal-binding transcriptional regulator
MTNEIFIVKPCSTRAAFEGVLKRQTKLDLTDYSRALSNRGYELVAVTDYIIVAKKEYEFTIFPSGRVLVKDIDDPDLAKTLIEKLYGDLGLV